MATLAKLTLIWKNICIKSKFERLRALTFSIVLYAGDSLKFKNRITVKHSSIRNDIVRNHPKHILLRHLK